MLGEEENEQAERNGEGPVIHSNNTAFLLMMHKEELKLFCTDSSHKKYFA